MIIRNTNGTLFIKWDKSFFIERSDRLREKYLKLMTKALKKKEKENDTI